MPEKAKHTYLKLREFMIRFNIGEGVSLALNNRAILKKWIAEVSEAEKKTSGELNFIFCTDDYLLSINREYLNHDYYTDVITFDYSLDNCIAGDIFISVDTVRVNAIKYHQAFENELYRVMVHGVLHLCGFKDHSREEKQQMRTKEDFYLAKILM